MFLFCPRERAVEISQKGREAINRKYRQRRRKSQKVRNKTMAEEVRNTENEQETLQNQQEHEKDNNEVENPITEEVMARAAQAEADAKKWKKEFDKQSSQIASLKKTVQSLKELQTAEQRKETEDQEAKEAHDAEFSRLQEFEKKTLAKERYLMQGMSVEMAAKAADAEVSGDMEALTDIQRQHTEATLKAAKAEWLNSTPQPNFGTGDYGSMSKKDIMAIKDTAERQKAILANRHLFGI